MEQLNKQKIIYIEHVEWNYIKQRPQYIAENLSKNFDVTVYSPYSYKLGKRNFKVDGSCDVKLVKKLPFEGRFPLIARLNLLYKKCYFKCRIKNDIPIVYVTYPEAYEFIPETYEGIVIYDCMDDMLEFDMSAQSRMLVQRLEKALYKRADIVFVSSENLKRKLFDRYFIKEDCYLVRNGYDGNIANVPLISEQKNKNFVVCYFGTISSWFDFDVIKKSLDTIPNLEYKFIGPIEKMITPYEHERIHYIRPVPHDELQHMTGDADAYILPFKVNDLIEAVDPVKFYEYINFSKNIISVYYDEILRFEDFVYFYKDTNQYINVIKKLMQDNTLKYSQEKRLKFLEESTWDNRAQMMSGVIVKELNTGAKHNIEVGVEQ